MAKGRSWLWNQSLVELGALVCTARRPVVRDVPVGFVLSVGPSRARGAPIRRRRGRPQSTFAGSDRQGRGRLLGLPFGSGRWRRRRIAGAAGWPDDVGRARRVAQSLVDDGLARRGRGGVLTLP